MVQRQGNTPPTEPMSSPFPIVPQLQVSISRQVRSRCAALAKRLVADDPALAGSRGFGMHVPSGLFDGPMLLIGNHTDLSLIATEEVTSISIDWPCSRVTTTWLL